MKKYLIILGLCLSSLSCTKGICWKEAAQDANAAWKFLQ